MANDDEIEQQLRKLRPQVTLSADELEVIKQLRKHDEQQAERQGDYTAWARLLDVIHAPDARMKRLEEINTRVALASARDLIPGLCTAQCRVTVSSEKRIVVHDERCLTWLAGKLLMHSAQRVDDEVLVQLGDTSGKEYGRCHVCTGAGYYTLTIDASHTPIETRYPCTACHGKGVIELP